jgi:hypothetical protein
MKRFVFIFLLMCSCAFGHDLNLGALPFTSTNRGGRLIASLSAQVGIPNVSETQITSITNVYGDLNSEFSSSAFTAKKAGWFDISSSLWWSTVGDTVAGIRSVRIFVNGIIFVGDTSAVSPNDTYYSHVSSGRWLNVGDTVITKAYQDSGGPATVTQCIFTVIRHP